MNTHSLTVDLLVDPFDDVDLPCSEPDGCELVDGVSAHELMLDEVGQCPWCGVDA